MSSPAHRATWFVPSSSVAVAVIRFQDPQNRGVTTR
jgi:hypothetical protein